MCVCEAIYNKTAQATMEELKPVKIAPKNWHSVKRKFTWIPSLCFSLSLFLSFYLARSHFTLSIPAHPSQTLLTSQMSCMTTCLAQIRADVLAGNNKIKIYKHNIVLIIITIIVRIIPKIRLQIIIWSLMPDVLNTWWCQHFTFFCFKICSTNHVAGGEA